jgi:hypothetical protein
MNAIDQNIIAQLYVNKESFRDCRKKPVQTMISYSGDAG